MLLYPEGLILGKYCLIMVGPMIPLMFGFNYFYLIGGFMPITSTAQARDKKWHTDSKQCILIIMWMARKPPRYVREKLTTPLHHPAIHTNINLTSLDTFLESSPFQGKVWPLAEPSRSYCHSTSALFPCPRRNGKN